MKCTKCGKETESNSVICDDCKKGLAIEIKPESNQGRENEKVFIEKKNDEFEKTNIAIEKLKVKPQRVMIFRVIMLIFEVILYVIGILSIILLIQSYKITVSDIFEVIGIDPSNVSYSDGKKFEKIILIIKEILVFTVIIDFLFAITFTYSRKQATRVIKQNKAIKMFKEIMSDIFDFYHKV